MKLFYVTFPSIEEGKRVIKELLTRRLIVCGNIFPSESLYLWENSVKEEKEVVAFLKTNKDIVKEIESMHSYDVPCILEIPVTGNEKYVNWLEDNLTK